MGNARSTEATNSLRAPESALATPNDALMPRVFAPLATANILLVAANTLLGLSAPAIPNSYHVALAIFTLILTCLIQVLWFTYLTITFKLMGQAVHIGKLPLEHLLAAKEIKRRMTHCLAVAVGTVLLTTATGADSWRAGVGGCVHLLLGLIFLLLLPYLLFTEFTLIARNAALVAAVMGQYTSRTEKTSTPA